MAAASFAMSACRDAPPTPAAASASASGSNTAPPEAPPRAASAAELAIIAPAAPDAKLEDFDIREVRGVARGTMEVHCEKGATRVVLSIALVVEGGPVPPASTDRYAVFYSLRGATPEDGERLAKALAALLKKNGAAAVPPGMGPFVPKPVSL
jgi:hypothetical protein